MLHQREKAGDPGCCMRTLCLLVITIDAVGIPESWESAPRVDFRHIQPFIFKTQDTPSKAALMRRS